MHRFESEGFGTILAKVAKRRRQGATVLPLHAGELDFDTPMSIVGAAKEALDRGDTRYTPAAGKPHLREAIAAYLSRTRGVPVNADQVVVTPGAKPMVFMALQALVEAGDEVVDFSPAYPIYCFLVRFMGAVPVPVALDPHASLVADVDALHAAVTDRTRLIIVNTPANPTGAVFMRTALDAIAEVALERDVTVLVDEIYSRIIYEGRFESVLAIEGMEDRCIIVDGFSKTFCMTGWRLGYGVMRSDLAARMATYMTNTLSCNVAFSQEAAVAALALEDAAIDEMVAVLARRRELVVSGLRRIPGVRCALPAGAFYVLADLTELGLSSASLAQMLLDEHGIATYPGSAFGPELEGYLRLSFGAPDGVLEQALEGIAELVDRVRTENSMRSS